MTENFWTRRSRSSRVLLGVLGVAGSLCVIGLVVSLMAEALIDPDCEDRARNQFELIERDVLELAFQSATIEATKVSQCDSAGTPFVEWPVRESPQQEMAPFAGRGWIKVSELSSNGRNPLTYEQTLKGTLYRVSSTERFVRASLVESSGS